MRLPFWLQVVFSLLQRLFYLVSDALFTIIEYFGFSRFSLDENRLISQAESLAQGHVNLKTNPSWRRLLTNVILTINSNRNIRHSRRKLLEKIISEEIAATVTYDKLAAKYLNHTNRISMKAPVFIIGPPRSGTTLMQRLLSLYPHVRYFSLVEQYFVETWSLHDRNALEQSDVIKARIRRDLARGYNEGLKVMSWLGIGLPQNVHYVAADAPDECVQVLNKYLFFSSFSSNTIGELHGGFKLALQDSDFVQNSWKLYHRDMKLIFHLNGGDESEKTFVLKAPHYTWFTDFIRKEFPGVRFVRMHRDPVDVAASLCSLFAQVQKGMLWKVDRAAIGRAVTDYLYTIYQRLLQESSQYNDSIDIHYRQLQEDKIGTCRTIAKFLAWKHTDTNDEIIEEFLQEQQKERLSLPQHTYSLSDYDLNSCKLREKFNDYCQKYGY